MLLPLAYACQKEGYRAGRLSAAPASFVWARPEEVPDPWQGIVFRGVYAEWLSEWR